MRLVGAPFVPVSSTRNSGDSPRLSATPGGGFTPAGLKIDVPFDSENDLGIRRGADEIGYAAEQCLLLVQNVGLVGAASRERQRSEEPLARSHHAERRATVATRQTTLNLGHRCTLEEQQIGRAGTVFEVRVRRERAEPEQQRIESVVLNVRGGNRRAFHTAAAEVVDEAVFPIRVHLAVDARAARGGSRSRSTTAERAAARPGRSSPCRTAPASASTPRRRHPPT